MKRKNRVGVARSSLQFFINGMNGHNAVEGISDLGDDIFLIKRSKDRPSLTILLADIYIAGEADIVEAISTPIKVDCIVLIGFYNRYSWAAKSIAKCAEIGLFDYREFFGAVNCTGKAFLNYERKKKDD